MATTGNLKRDTLGPLDSTLSIFAASDAFRLLEDLLPAQSELFLESNVARLLTGCTDTKFRVQPPVQWLLCSRCSTGCARSLWPLRWTSAHLY